MDFREANSLEMTKATAALEHASLKPPLLLNAGGLGAWAAFSLSNDAAAMWTYGVVLAVLAVWVGFWSQLSFHRHRSQEILGNADASEKYAETGGRMRNVSMLLVVLSLGFFVWGMIIVAP